MGEDRMETVKEMIEKHIPCDVCGNDNVSKFQLRELLKMDKSL